MTLRSAITPVLLLMLSSCSAISTQKSLPPAADAADHRNLQVLSPNITREQLLATMRTFTRGLGVGCAHCHVNNGTEAEPEFDFASDAKHEKDVARQMLIMTRQINEDHISRVNVYGASVTCMTCHRGRPIPSDVAEPTDAAVPR